MSFDSRNKEVRFLSEKPTSNWGLGGWSLLLLAISMSLGLYAIYRTQSGMACIYSLCTEPFTAQESSILISIVISALILWLGAIIMGVFGCITRSNTLAAGLVLFVSLAPTVYVLMELLKALFAGLTS